MTKTANDFAAEAEDKKRMAETSEETKERIICSVARYFAPTLSYPEVKLRLEQLEETQEEIDELKWGQQVSDDFVQDVRKRLPIILDFVERWNKQDKEEDVAEAARFLGEYFEEKVAP
jgi:hypothetical protein